MHFKTFKITFFILFGIVVLVTLYFQLSFLNIALWLAIYIAVMAWGSFRIRSNFFVPSINNIKSPGVVLTFDDGPDPEHTPAILDVLKKHNAKAVFFCIGEKLRKHPDIANRIHTEGHIIGNHTYSHSKLWGFLPQSQVEREISLTQQVIQEITETENQYFRPPFGVTNPQIARGIEKLGITSVGWNVRSLDTVKNDPQDVIKRLSNKITDGSIVLLHDNLPNASLIAESVLEKCGEEGLDVVGLDEVDNAN